MVEITDARRVKTNNWIVLSTMSGTVPWMQMRVYENRMVTSWVVRIDGA
jgi:hypothetical protein